METSAGSHFYFILTGGTEGIVLRDLAAQGGSTRDNPVILIAHPAHNSLPAAMEILAKIRQEEGFGLLCLLPSPGLAEADKEALAGLQAMARAHGAVRSMRSSRIGALGEPSDWLVASGQPDEAVAASWGASMDHLSIEELKAELKALRAQDLAASIPGTDLALRPEMSAFLGKAGFRGEPVRHDLYKSDTIYRALGGIVSKRGWDAFTLRCFDLVTSDASTGCYALSAFADEGIDAGCEGDIPSVLGLRWMRLLTGKPAWMANPADIHFPGDGTGRLLLAHCTVPRSIVESYGIRSHFESGLGLAIAGKFAPGTVTLARIGGRNLDRLWLAQAKVLESRLKEGLCRTQLLLEMQASDLSKLIEEPLGNHLVVGMGGVADLARYYARLQGIREI
jgi:L-fucose isomerase-like protein